MTCPECGSPDIRASRHARKGDILQRIRGKKAFRCRNCQKRFFVSLFSPSRSKQLLPSSRSRRSRSYLSLATRRRLAHWLVVIATFAVALVLFLLFLRYLTAEKIHPRNSVSVRARHAVSLSSAPLSGSQLAFIRPANSLVRR